MISLQPTTINPNNKKMLLSCDGGGIRGLIIARCLERLEETEGKPCREIFDFMAGTSTGAIIVGALCAGLPAKEIVSLYKEKGRDMFQKRMPWNWLWWRYDKKRLRKIFAEIFGDLTLGDFLPRHILIMTKDTARSETIFLENWRTFKEMYLRDAVEASMSAPTFFEPKGDLVDGGVGSFNNPCYQATVEALYYLKEDYHQGAVRLLSFGTGTSVNALQKGEARRKTIFFWAPYVIGEGMDDAHDQQTWLVRHEYARQGLLEFRRYQLSLSEEVVRQLGVSINSSTLHRLKLDAVNYIEELDEIACAFASKIDFHNEEGCELMQPKEKLTLENYT